MFRLTKVILSVVFLFNTYMSSALADVYLIPKFSPLVNTLDIEDLDDSDNTSVSNHISELASPNELLKSTEKVDDLISFLSTTVEKVSEEDQLQSILKGLKNIQDLIGTSQLQIDWTEKNITDEEARDARVGVLAKLMVSIEKPIKDISEKLSTIRKDEDVGGFSGSPNVIADLSNGDLSPGLKVGLQNPIYKDWVSFSGYIKLNDSVEGEDNQRIVESYLSKGGNIDFDMNIFLGGRTFYGFASAKFSYVDAQEYDSSNSSTPLKESLGGLGGGLGFRIQDRFSLTYSLLHTTQLHSSDTVSSFVQSLDKENIQNVNLLMEYIPDAAEPGDAKNYIQLTYSWGAEDADPVIGLGVTTKFDFF